MSGKPNGHRTFIGSLADEGGEAPCWAHLFDEARSDIVDADDVERRVPVSRIPYQTVLSNGGNDAFSGHEPAQGGRLGG